MGAREQARLARGQVSTVGCSAAIGTHPYASKRSSAVEKPRSVATVDASRSVTKSPPPAATKATSAAGSPCGGTLPLPLSSRTAS